MFKMFEQMFSNMSATEVIGLYYWGIAVGAMVMFVLYPTLERFLENMAAKIQARRIAKKEES